MRIRRTRGALADVQAIWRYVATNDLAAANRLAARIISATDRLAAHPESGSPRPDIHPDARSIPVGSYIIFYRATSSTVEIVAVRHGARDQAEVAATFS